MASPHLAGAGRSLPVKERTVSPAITEATLKTNVLSPGTLGKDDRAIEIAYEGRY